MASPIDPTLIAQFIDLYPEMVALSYLPRTGANLADSLGAGVSQTKCRQFEPNLELLIALGAEVGSQWCEWHVWSLGQTMPIQEGVLVDPAGKRWVVKHVRKQLLDKMHVCTCVKEVA